LAARGGNGGKRGLVIGVTGHRPQHLGVARVARLTSDARAVMQTLVATQSNPPLLCSALAEGADRVFAQIALDCGCALRAVLPFQRDEYAGDFVSSASRAEYAALLDRSAEIVELAGERRRPDHAYEAAGHTILDTADLLLAMWDGAPGRGRGGTAAVVAEAWQRQLPVVHLSTRAHAPPTLLWHMESTPPPALDRWHLPDRPCDDDALRALVQSLHARKGGAQ
jgi:hypothetical protein